MGTGLVSYRHEIPTPRAVGQLVALDGRLYFNLSTENRLQLLMVFDPAKPSAGVSLAMDSNAYPDIDSIRPWATAFDGALYFLAGDSAHGNELWAYDPDCQAEGRHGLVQAVNRQTSGNDYDTR